MSDTTTRGVALKAATLPPAKTRLVHGSLPDGGALRLLKMHRDDRGSFTEIFYAAWGLCIAPVQWSAVESRAGTLRGMHLHRRHDEYVCVLRGHLYVGLLDLRPGSPTEGRSALVEMSGGECGCLSFPQGVVHGWLAASDALHVQAVSEDYTQYGHDDNPGCHWSDPELDIPWPFPPTLVSARAESFGTVADLRRWMRQGVGG